MATTKTTVMERPTWPVEVFEDATVKIIDGCLVVTTQKIAKMYAPGQWLSAWTEKIDASAS